MLVDVVIPQLTERGGLDKIINTLLESLECSKIHFRLIELVSWGLKWWNDSFDYHSMYKIDDEHGGINYYESALLYADFLNSGEKPNVIMATGWPVTVNIVKAATDRIGISPIVVGWPHMALDQESAGVGDVKCMERADIVIAISHLIANQVKEIFPNKSVYVINNPIKLESIPFNSKKVNGNLLKISYVGRLIESKGLETIFDAMLKASSEIELTVIGSGQEKETWDMVLSRDLASNVKMLGWRDTPWEHTKDSSFFVTASKAEGFGLTTIEALASGLPVISTPVGCSPNVIKPGENGYLFPIGDSDMLAKIFDCICAGLLPIPNSNICRESVRIFDEENIVSQYREVLFLLR